MRTRWRSGRLAAVVAVVLAAAACGGGAATGDVSSFAIETSDLYITVRNTAGLALNDIRVEIVPAGRPNVYGASILRLENSEKRDISLSGFKDREGASFNLRMAKPKSVVLTGHDLSGKVIKAELPWK